MDLKHDSDRQETQEWLESLASVLERNGHERAHFLLERLIRQARRQGVSLPYQANTSYINTIAPDLEAHSDNADHEIERRIRSYIRWNATMMVLRANKVSPELGGHIATFASSATLYDVGFNHFFQGPTADHGGDLLFVQGHAAPGIYARAFLEGRLSAEQLDHFRREVDGKGLSSYPHPWLMPNFWQFPTVSMGLGPLMGIYQARFMKYLHHRKMADTSKRKVWVFTGDGEMDEPESLGAIGLASREKLDNLIFVINCNLQRLDGPVRGNGKIIQELEGVFHGAGWKVIKVIWGSHWDALLARDKTGKLLQLMDETVDGEYQNCKAKGGAYTREHFFGKYEETRNLVAHMSDDDIWRLNRGGHDPHKVYAAYHEAVNHKSQPVVILAKTVKGYGMGTAGEAYNIIHSQKKMDKSALLEMRERFKIPLSEEQIGRAEYMTLEPDSPEARYLHQRREALGGFLPQRSNRAKPLDMPPLSEFSSLLESSGERELSTTTAFVRLLTKLCRDKNIGAHIVPIVPDEARTFGMESMFRQLGIYSFEGQQYEPQDRDQVMFYKEDKSGQILEEGVNEAGAMSSWVAAATAYSAHAINMIPFYIYYSMFGFQRIGDLAWAAGDARARGFMIGATAGRTTLAGEGLQHQDGHSLLQAALIPNCIAYDPCFAFELAVIVHNGLIRMNHDREPVFFYLTVTNENYPHPAMPEVENIEQKIIEGMYQLSPPTNKQDDKHVRLMGSGAILREVIAAAEILHTDWQVSSELWSAPGINQLRAEGVDCERWNRLHPDQTARIPLVTQNLADGSGPLIVATDYIRAYPEQIRPFVPCPYHVLGTDGFGRSDTRANLRKFFEVDRYHVVTTALHALAQQGILPASQVKKALKKYRVDVDVANPVGR